MRINRRSLISTLLLAALACGVAACGEGKRYDQAVCVLIDVSGTYVDQLAEVVRIVKSEVLPSMEPGDTLLVLRIDGESYEKDNVEVLVTLDARPSRANAEKLGIAQRLDELAKREGAARHTDILGAMMLGSEYLRELASGSRVMLIFSDMEQDLPAGVKRKTHETEFEDIRVLAINVKRLQGDNIDPEGFRDRLSAWEKSVMAANAVGWQVMMDSTKLPKLLAQIR